MNARTRKIGIHFPASGTAAVCVWAPEAGRVELIFDNTALPLQQEDQGYWTIETNRLTEGMQYRFRMDDGNPYPDPASLCQPQGVHGASQAVNLHRFAWSDSEWKNPALEDYIFYEVHVGTFTTAGDLAAIEEKLDYLVNLGITAIELMPLAQFAGDRNWGYDGVCPFAVHQAYGGAEALQHLVDACHQKGLAVVLDVVYNHLGPEGNYLPAFGPYITEKYRTPWGGAINFDDAWCDGVRNYFVENMLMWFRDFHIDALRLDAVHAIRDFSPKHILQEMREHADALMAATGRRHYLIVESDLNDPRYINPLREQGYGMDAQWIDEFHHALRIAAGEAPTGYYADFNGIGHLAKAYRDAYVYDGQFSPHRKKHFGVRTHNPGRQFIVFSQNHDQVGNRMMGERTSRLAGYELQKLLAAAVLASPYLPLLFMGEEWSAPHPFLYFVSHTDPELAEAVRRGRKAEFAAFHAEGEAPDPVDEQTFLRSKLQWSLPELEPHRAMLQYYRALIALRKTHPVLRRADRKNLLVECHEQNAVLTLHRWHDEQHLLCLMNFSKKQQSVMPPSHASPWHKIFDSAAPEWQGPQAAPKTITGGQPGSSTLVLQPESAVLYESQG